MLNDVHGKLMFVVDDGVHGEELWISDGSSTGTSLVLDINPLTPSSNIFSPIATANGHLFFGADDGVHGQKPWISDRHRRGHLHGERREPRGQRRGHQRVGRYKPRRGAAGKYFFPGNDAVHGIELWRSDGTSTGTTLVADIYPGGNGAPTALYAWNGYIYFSGVDAPNNGELWKSDGTAANTVKVKELDATASVGGYPHSFTPVGSRLFLLTSGGGLGYNVWLTRWPRPAAQSR